MTAIEWLVKILIFSVYAFIGIRFATIIIIKNK